MNTPRQINTHIAMFRAGDAAQNRGLATTNENNDIVINMYIRICNSDTMLAVLSRIFSNGVVILLNP